MKPKILVILGPTATGKSDFAVKIAKKFNGEIISADSRQVYKGMNLGTGKITKKEMLGIPHHLLDVANPKEVYTVNKYKIQAQKAIADILRRGKVPILCGGTGFYLDAIIKNLILPDVPPNPQLRKKLEQESLAQLFLRLKRLDPTRAKTIDRYNPRRLIRAIEIATALGRVPVQKIEHNFNTLKLGLTLPDSVLRERINLRLKKRILAGMLSEAKKLHQQGLSWKRMEDLGLEYRYEARYLTNQITKEQMITELQNKIWQYARRQKTWFKRDKDIIWINPLKNSDIIKTYKLIGKFLYEK